MHVLLQILKSVGAKSSVPDTVFATVGALANALEEDFAKYMESFTPFLYSALGNQEEPALCAMAVGLVSDVTRSLGEVSQPYCDAFMNYLLQILSVSHHRGHRYLSSNSDENTDCCIGTHERPPTAPSHLTMFWRYGPGHWSPF